MKELEQNIEKRLTTWLNNHGVKHLKLNVMYSRGWPDRCIFIPGGRPFLCELKRPGEDLTPLQKEVHAQLKSLGYDVETHWSSETAIEAVEARLRERRDTEEALGYAVSQLHLTEGKSVFERVDALRVSEESRQVAPHSPRRRAVPRPRTR